MSKEIKEMTIEQKAAAVHLRCEPTCVDCKFHEYDFGPKREESCIHVCNKHGFKMQLCINICDDFASSFIHESKKNEEINPSYSRD